LVPTGQYSFQRRVSVHSRRSVFKDNEAKLLQDKKASINPWHRDARTQPHWTTSGRTAGRYKIVTNVMSLGFPDCWGTKLVDEDVLDVPELVLTAARMWMIGIVIVNVNSRAC
jgi:hypothetical protein